MNKNNNNTQSVSLLRYVSLTLKLGLVSGFLVGGNH